VSQYWIHISHSVTVLDTIYRTVSQNWISYKAQCHNTGNDISHTVTVLDTIYRSVSQYWLRYIAQGHGIG